MPAWLWPREEEPRGTAAVATRLRGENMYAWYHRHSHRFIRLGACHVAPPRHSFQETALLGQADVMRSLDSPWLVPFLGLAQTPDGEVAIVTQFQALGA